MIQRLATGEDVDRLPSSSGQVDGLLRRDCHRGTEALRRRIASRQDVPSHHPQVFFSKSAESLQNKGVAISESPKTCKRVHKSMKRKGIEDGK